MLSATGEKYLCEAMPRIGDAETIFIAALDNARHQKALARDFEQRLA
jgi:hypothetical protein